MLRKKWFVIMAVLVISSMVLTACPSGTPEKEIVEVVKTVEVTKVVEKEVIKEVVVTPTPAPVTFESPDPNTMVVATIGDPETLDPALNYETAGANIIQNVYETLVYYNKDDATSFVPQLATDWTISDDGLTYTFTIRKGVKFHNGADLTPEDVAYSFQRGLLQGGPDSPQWLLTEPFLGVGIYDIADLIDPELEGDPEGLQATDPDKLMEVCQQVKDAIVADEENWTVTFHLAQPWGPFLATIAQGWGSIMDKDWVIENGGWDGDCATWAKYYGVTSENDPFTNIMNGTGPYKLERWTPGEEIVLVRNENYWRTPEVGPAWEGGPVGPAAIERIVIKSVSEWGTRFAMLQAGDADTAYVPRQNVSQVDPLVGEICEYQEDGSFNCQPSDNPDAPLRLYKGMPGVSRTDAFFVFNINVEGGNPFIGSGQLDGNGIPPDFFSDIHVRRAFNYCFDWEAFIEEALNGEAVQNVGVLIPGMLGYDPNGPKYTYDPEKCAEEFKQAWDGQVWEKGFRLQIAYNTGNVTRQTVAAILQATLADVNDKFQVEIVGLPWPTFLRQIRGGRLPIFVSGWLEDIHDPHNWAQPFTVGTYARRQNMPEELLDKFTELVNAGVSETDPAKRAEIYKKLSELDYEYAPAIRLAVATGRRYEQRWVQGWYYNPIYPGTYYYALSEK